MKNKRILLIAEILFLCLSLILILLISLLNDDEWTQFGDRLWMVAFVYFPILIVGACTIHTVFSRLLIKGKRKILAWIIVILSALYLVYLLIDLFVIGHLTAAWYVIPIIVIAFWTADRI